MVGKEELEGCAGVRAQGINPESEDLKDSEGVIIRIISDEETRNRRETSMIHEAHPSTASASKHRRQGGNRRFRRMRRSPISRNKSGVGEPEGVLSFGVCDKLP